MPSTTATSSSDIIRIRKCFATREEWDTANQNGSIGRIVCINGSEIVSAAAAAVADDDQQYDFPLAVEIEVDKTAMTMMTSPTSFAEEKKADDGWNDEDDDKSNNNNNSHNNSLIEEDETPVLPPISSEYTIFVQSSTGAFFPADTITNASVIAVRHSITTPLPPRTRVQWYRGSTTPNEWIPLEGATRPLYQPTAVDIGYPLHCQVLGSRFRTSPTVPVQADAALWNVTLHHNNNNNTAGFVLQGRGPATGRSIRVAIQTGNLLLLHQQHCTDRIPLAPHPIPIVTATAGTHPKQLTLQCAGIPSDCLLAALVVGDCGMLELTAPNRMARESVLLAIGIANYKSKNGGDDGEVVLDTTVPLYGHNFCDPATKCVVDSCSNDDNKNTGATTTSTEKSTSDSETAAAADDDDEPIDELTALREKLARKDKIIAELQRQLADSDATVRAAESTARSHATALAAEQERHAATQAANAQTERRLQVLETERQRVAATHSVEIRNLQSQLQEQSHQTATATKAHRTLQHETTMLTATLAARDNKLAQLSTVQQDYHTAQTTLTELQQAHRLCQEQLAASKSHLSRVIAARVAAETQQTQLTARLQTAQADLQQAHQDRDAQTALATACRERLSQEQVRFEKIKAERNSYQQRFHSVAKEMSRVCTNGRTMRHVEQLVADDAARREEVQVLRQQHKTVREERDHWRKAYADAVRAAAESNSTGGGSSSWARKERVAELERLVADLTAYVAAQEMQVATLREVNATLQTELRELARVTKTAGDV